MSQLLTARVSGHVFLRGGHRGGVYYLRYRLADGRHVKRRLGRAWSGRGRPPAGYCTARMARDALEAALTDARRGTLAGITTPGTTFADASAEWLRYVEHDRDVKPSTLSDHRHMVGRLDREPGDMRIERITAERIERWRGALSCSNRTVHKYLIVLNGVFKRAMKVYGLPANPMTLVERPRVRQRSDIDVLSAPELRALLRATPDELQRAILLTAAFAGLRMGELLALRWGDVDFPAQTIRVVRSFTIGGSRARSPAVPARSR